jgi:hypothetical protein
MGKLEFHFQISETRINTRALGAGVHNLSDTRQPPTWKYSEPEEGTERYYANHVTVFWSGVDLTLIFGELTHSPENITQNVIEVVNKAEVTIPWSVAKLIMANLTSTIAKYEEKNGELKLPGEHQIP